MVGLRLTVAFFSNNMNTISNLLSAPQVQFCFISTFPGSELAFFGPHLLIACSMEIRKLGKSLGVRLALSMVHRALMFDHVLVWYNCWRAWTGLMVWLPGKNNLIAKSAYKDPFLSSHFPRIVTTPQDRCLTIGTVQEWMREGFMCHRESGRAKKVER